jgi:Flp pilus assembly protein TadD
MACRIPAFSRVALVAAVLSLTACQSGGLAGLLDPEEAVAPAHAGLMLAAKQAFRDGDLARAESRFAAAVKENDGDPEALLGLAATYDRLARWDAADAAYARVIAVAGRRPEVLNNLGTSLYLRGDRARARLVFEEAARLDPANPVLQANLLLVAS